MTLKEEINWCKIQLKQGYEVIAINSILTRLKGLEKPKEPPHQYHNQAMQAYKDFLKRYGLPPVVDERQGAALKQLLPKLQTLTITKSPEGAYHALIFILTNWNKTSPYHQKQKTLSHINNNLVELLDQIRNGATKKQSSIAEARRFHNELTNQ